MTTPPAATGSAPTDPAVVASAPAASTAAGPDGPIWPGSTLATQVTVLTGRLLRSLRDPRMLVVSVVQPLIMLALFSQMFRTLADSPHFPDGVRYIDYLLPALLVTTTTQATVWAGVALADDLREGLVSRLRTMPVSLLALLAARSLYAAARNALQLVVLVVVGVVLFDYRPGGPLGATAALLVALMVSWGLSWVFLGLGARIRNPELLQTFGMVVIFPLAFVSSAFVPLAGLPAGARAVATANPLTQAVEAARGLSLGTPSAGWITAVLLASAVLAAGGGIWASREVRRVG
ncbi:ABC transporter permease [Streptomyces sp. GD-15H]|uniref:ABC transporter permease n=1 Tax=Streptomyces sp. GD-15H TaxID=3129112 RepID=UPI00325302B4